MTSTIADPIKAALYLILEDKMAEEMYHAKHVQKDVYDGCGCSNTILVEDKEQVKRVKEKYQSILNALKRKEG